MRLLLLIAVIALGIDALYFSGAYTQTAYREASAAILRLSTSFREGGPDTPRPAAKEDARRSPTNTGERR